MLTQLLIFIILYIIFNEIILTFRTFNNESENKELPQEKPKKNNINVNLFGKPIQHVQNDYIIWKFDKPLPWTQIIYKYGDDFPFNFFIKVTISSLNDYSTWKQIIPNLNFDAKTGNLIIPSKDAYTSSPVFKSISTPL